MKKRFIYLSILAIVPVLLTIAVTAVLSAPHTSGDPLIYSTFLGESATEKGYSITFDQTGHAYVVGYSESTTFPTSTLPFQPNHGIDVYVAKLNPDGQTMAYILWFNATSLFAEDYAYSIAVDDEGSAYVVGDTRSSDFCQVFGPVPGYDTTYNDNGDAFAFKVNPQGTGLEYCTFLGGNDLDIARAITIDEEGAAYVTGGTWSLDFATTPGAFDTTHGGERDGFLVKLDPTGTALEYATFLGADQQEEGVAVALDANHNASVIGWTRSTNFYTTTNAFDTTHNGGIFDGFLFTLNATGDTLLYASFIGGMGEDKPTSLFIDEAGHTYLAGYTASSDFPTTPNAFDPDYNSGFDGFALKLTPPGDDLIYSTYLGGSSEDWNWGLDVDHSGVAYITGETWSSDFPTTTLAFDGNLTGGQDGFVTQLSNDGTALLYSTYLGGNDWDDGLDVGTDGLGRVYLTGSTRSPDFPTTPLAYDTTHNGAYDVFITKLEVVNTFVPLDDVTIAGPTTGVINHTYPFTATVTPSQTTQPITYLWQTADHAPITHTGGLSHTINWAWAAAGTYTVTVTARNLDSVVSATHTLVISTNVEANFTANATQGQVPLTVAFTNTSGGDYDTVLWDFGDNVTSTITHPTHIYTDAGTYTVTLTISGPGGTDTRTRTAYIHVDYRLYLPAIQRNE